MTDCGCTNFPASLGNVTFGASVGIGTAAPAGQLDVSGSGGTVAAYVGPSDDNYGVLVLRGGSVGTFWELAKLRTEDPSPNGFSLLAVDGGTATSVLTATTSGQVGIGTTSPTAALDVDSATAPQLVVRGGATSSIRVFPAPGNAIASMEAFTTADSIPDPTNYSRLRLTIDGQTAGVVADAGGTGTALPLTLSAGGAERLRVTPSGNLGVGTSNPEVAVHVAGTVLATGSGRFALGLNNGSDPATSKTWLLDNDAGPQGTASDLRFYQQPTLTSPGSVYLIIKDGGNVGVGTTSPGYPLDVEGGVNTATAYFAGGVKVADPSGCYYA